MANLDQIIQRGNPMARKDSVETIIRRGLAEIVDYDRDGRMYASQAAYCSRQAMLSSTYHGTEVITPAGKSYMAIGVAVEEMIVDALYKQGVLFFKQYKIKDVGLNMGGYIDAVIYVDGKVKVLEIKTCGELPEKPKPEHRAQALVYNAITGIPASVLYFSRSVAGFDQKLKIRELPLHATHEELLATVYNAAYAYFAILEGVVPPRPNFSGPGACGFCKFKDICWDGAEAPHPVASATQHARLARLANEKAKALMAPEQILDRRRGVLNFMANHGTEHAKAFLPTAVWDDII